MGERMRVGTSKLTGGRIDWTGGGMDVVRAFFGGEGGESAGTARFGGEDTALAREDIPEKPI